MATLNSIIIHQPSPLTSKPFNNSSKFSSSPLLFPIKPTTRSWKPHPLTSKRTTWVVGSLTEDKEEVIPIDDKEEVDVTGIANETGPEEVKGGDPIDGGIDESISRTINAAIVLGAGTIAVTRLLTIDHDYWQVSLSY